MNETEFNAVLRSVLRCHGLRALHVREADNPGASDLVVWRGRTLLAWAELKVDDRIVESQQHQFLMEREEEAGNAYIIRYSNTSGLTTVSRPTPGNTSRVLTILNNFRLYGWPEFFDKTRREV